MILVQFLTGFIFWLYRLVLLARRILRLLLDMPIVQCVRLRIAIPERQHDK